MAMIDGRDRQAGVTVDRINVWATPERSPGRVVDQVRNYSTVKLLRTKRGGDQTMFEIGMFGQRLGWVSELFVTPIE